jgi:hypothetical protein
MTKISVLSNVQSRLTLIELVGVSKSNKPIGLYKCSCGNAKEILVPNVVNGKSKSCGCLRAELLSENKPAKKHGLAKTPIYDVWHLMHRRCYEVGSKNYHQYGGRGITVCPEWHDVEVFSQWAFDNGYAQGLQLDREDNYGMYEPSNCHFVSSKINNNNRRDNRLIRYAGKTQTLQQWADETGLNTATIRMRLDKLHWSVEKALTQKLR